ncbi:hypothetical protein BH11MYX4_BH11MYX4_59680 [soil metagenome]
MPRAPLPDEDDEDEVREFLGSRKGLKHLRVRRRADLLTLESGPASDPVRHARLRRVTVHYWTLECATHTGRWEKTGLRGPMDKILEVLTTEISWVLAPVV